MNANDVIDAYLEEVATQLPRKQRGDVTLELRALLGEELQAKAEAAGRDVDADLATDFLRSFGRPGDVAARYRSPLTIIDPADGRSFLQATVVGLAILWGLGLFASVRGVPIPSGWDLLTVLGRWWTGVVLPSMAWPGILVASFAFGSWVRRRWPQSGQWKPRGQNRHQNRGLMVLALAGVLFGMFLLLNPTWVLDVFWKGRAAPAAYEALSFTDSFRQRQAPWLIVLLALNVPMFVAAIATGRRSNTMKRVELELSLVMCAVLAWTLSDGPILASPASDSTARGILVLLIAITLLDVALELNRKVRPARVR